MLKIDNLKNNDIVKIEVAVAVSNNGLDLGEQRETDFVTITTPFSTLTKNYKLIKTKIKKPVRGLSMTRK